MMARSPHSPSAVTYCRRQGIIIHTRTLQDLFAHPFRAGMPAIAPRTARCASPTAVDDQGKRCATLDTMSSMLCATPTSVGGYGL